MIRVTILNGLDQDQDPRYVNPDRGQNCLQRLTASDKIRPKQGKCSGSMSIDTNSTYPSMTHQALTKSLKTSSPYSFKA